MIKKTPLIFTQHIFIFLFLLFLPFVAFGREITTAWALNAGNINPHLYSPNQMYAQIMLYQPLIRFDGQKFVGEIAESWEISKDNKTYTFFIKENLLFSDGSPLDAYAIEVNFKAILENKMRHSWLGITQKIISAKALDSKTFELKLKSPYIATLNELSLPRPFRFIAPSAMLNGSTKNGIKAPIGSGAWILKESRLGAYDIFVPNPYYHGNKPQISKLTIKILPDANSRILAFESGALDILVGKDSISRENFLRLSKNAKYQTIQSQPQGTFHIIINASKDRKTADIHLRKAILAAIDKQSILEKILLKIDKPANSLFNPSLEFCNTTMQNATFNPQKAKENLTQSTYNQESLQFVYVANNPIQKAIAEAIQNNLAKSGIKIELIASEPISFFQKQKNGDFDLIFNETWGNPFDPHSFIASMLIPSHADFAAQKDLNSRQKIESTIHKILNQTDEKILKHDYQTLLNLLDESAIYLPLSHNVVLGIYNKNKIKSYQIGAMETEFLFEKMEVK